METRPRVVVLDEVESASNRLFLHPECYKKCYPTILVATKNIYPNKNLGESKCGKQRKSMLALLRLITAEVRILPITVYATLDICAVPLCDITCLHDCRCEGNFRSAPLYFERSFTELFLLNRLIVLETF